MADLQTVVYKLQADITDIKTAFATVQDQIKKTNTAVTGMGASHQAALTQTAHGVESLGTKYEELAESLHSKVHPALAAVEAGLVGLGLEASLREVANLSDEWNNLKSQLILTGTATNQVGTVMQDLFGIAQKTGQSFQGLTEMYGRVQRSTKDMGLSQSQLIALTKNLSVAVAASGVSANTAQMGLYQLAQAFSVGKLAGQDMRAVVEEMPGVLDLVKKYCDQLGISFQTLKNSSGISATFIAAALVNMGDEVDKISQTIPDSFDKAFTRAKNNLFNIVGQMTDQGLFKPAIQAMNQLSDIFSSPAFQQGVANVTTDIVNLVSFMAANIGSVERFTAAVSGAWLGARVGGAAGAAAGSIVPGLGTAAGGALGMIGGAVVGAATGLYATSGHADPPTDQAAQLAHLQSQLDHLKTTRQNLANTPPYPGIVEDQRQVDDALTVVQQKYDKLKTSIVETGKAAAGTADTSKDAAGKLAPGVDLGNSSVLKNLNIGEVVDQNKKMAEAIFQAQLDAARNSQLQAAAGADPLTFRRQQAEVQAQAQLDRFKIPPTLGFPGSAKALGLSVGDAGLTDALDASKPDAVRAANAAMTARMQQLAGANTRAQFDTSNIQQAAQFRETLLDEGKETSQLAKVTDQGATAYEHAKVLLDAYLQVKRQHLALSASEQATLAKTIAATQEQTKVTGEVVAAREKFEQQKRVMETNKGAIGLDENFKPVPAQDAAFIRPEELTLMQQRQQYMDSFLESIKDVTDPAQRAKLVDMAKGWELNDEAMKKVAESAKLVSQQTQTAAEDNRLKTALGPGSLSGTLNAYNKERMEISAENTVLATYHTLQTQDAQDAYKRALAHEQTSAALQTEQALIQSASEPFKSAIDNVQTDLAGFFDTILQNGQDAWKTLGQGFEDTMRKAVSNFLAAAVLDPQKFGALLKGIQGQIATGNGINPDGTVATGGQRMLANIQLGTEGTAVGTTVGGFVTSATGGNQQTAGMGSAVGGIVGGIAGSYFGPMGTMVGAMVGSALGGIVGGMFGGGTTGKNNDAQGYFYDPDTRQITKTDKKGSTQNANAARQLIDQGKTSIDTLASFGLAYGGQGPTFKVGNTSGIEFNGKSFASSEDALQAAIKQIISDTTGNVSATINTILENTKANSAQALQADLQFAHTYDQLINGSDQFLDSLYNLKMGFEDAKVKAADLGLNVQALSDAEDKAVKKLQDDTLTQLTQQTEQAADQIRSYLQGLITPYKNALTSIRGTVESPQSQITSLLSTFRGTYKDAANDNQAALASLPQLGQQLITLAQQYGASGATFQAIYQEVTRDLSAVMKTQTDRQTEILASIPDTIKFTAQEQINALVKGFNDLLDKLDQVRTDIRNAA